MKPQYISSHYLNLIEESIARNYSRGDDSGFAIDQVCIHGSKFVVMFTRWYASAIGKPGTVMESRIQVFSVDDSGDLAAESGIIA